MTTVPTSMGQFGPSALYLFNLFLTCFVVSRGQLDHQAQVEQRVRKDLKEIQDHLDGMDGTVKQEHL